MNAKEKDVRKCINRTRDKNLAETKCLAVKLNGLIKSERKTVLKL